MDAIPDLRRKGGRPPGKQNLTPKKAAFVAAYLETGQGAASAVKAGYSVKNANHTSWRLLHHDKSVQAAVEAGQLELRQRAQLTAEGLLKQLAADREFAISKGHCMAVVKASEMQAKLSGLMVERVDQRTVGQIKVEIVRFGRED